MSELPSEVVFFSNLIFETTFESTFYSLLSNGGHDGFQI